MTDKDYFELRDELKKSAERLSKAKGKEYANVYAEEFDRLFNFKAVAFLLGISPELVGLVLLLKPILSLSSTVKRIEAGEKLIDIDEDLTESTKSRSQDIDNYNSLIWGLLNERMEREKKEKLKEQFKEKKNE